MTNANNSAINSVINRLDINAIYSPGARIYLIATALWVFQIILSFVKSIELSVLGLISREYMSFSLCGYWSTSGVTIYPMIVTILCALCAAFMMIPVLTNRANKARRFIMQKITAILCVLLAMYPMFEASQAKNSSYGLASGHSGFAAWLYLINCFVLLVVSFMVSARNRKKHAPAQNDNA